MRVCFLVPDLSPSGGIGVVREHAHRLREEHDVAAEVLTPAEVSGSWDVAVATWWNTISALGHVPAARRGVMVQGFDPLHYRAEEVADAIAATAALAAPYDVIAVSDWAAQMVRALRPEAACHVVRPGVDPTVFGGADRAAADGPLRVLIDGQPSVWFKGVDEALAATAAMTRRPHVTVVATDPPPALDGADRVVGGLDAAGMARLYREVDVVLKLSRHEGLGLVPIEAFHAGVPCVVTPYGGHAEYLRDAENGLLVGFDDVAGTARMLDRIDADRDLLAKLSAGALESAAAWPDPATSTARLRDVLGELGSGDGAGVALDAVLSRALPARAQLSRLHAELDVRARAISHEQERVAELERARADLDADLIERTTQLVEAQEQVSIYSQAAQDFSKQLEDTRASRAYRLATSLRSLRPRRR